MDSVRASADGFSRKERGSMACPFCFSVKVRKGPFEKGSSPIIWRYSSGAETGVATVSTSGVAAAMPFKERIFG